MQQKTSPLLGQGWQRALLFFIILVLVNQALIQYVFSNVSGEEMFPFLPGLALITGLILTGAIVTVTLVFIFCRLIDKIPVAKLGLSGDVKTMLPGFFLAASVLGAGSMILVATGILQWVDWNFNEKEFFTSLVLMLIVAFSEELSFRGYVLGNLLQSFSRPAAIALSACAFVLMHAANPAMEVIPGVNLLLGGILLGQCYAIDRNLWMPVGFHFAWNFLQGPVLGFRVSGIQLVSVLDQQLAGREWITGGLFGFEGSIVATVVLLAGVVIMEFHSRRLGL